MTMTKPFELADLIFDSIQNEYGIVVNVWFDYNRRKLCDIMWLGRWRDGKVKSSQYLDKGYLVFNGFSSWKVIE